MKTRLNISEPREVMDIRQASEYLGISPDTLYKYASEGTIPAFKLGNRWRFKRSLMDGWMDDQSAASMACNKVTVMPPPLVETQVAAHGATHGRSKPPASVRPRQKRPSRLVN
jgi:excisionase family DNA binding protein